jgi:hypothetical protein
LRGEASQSLSFSFSQRQEKVKAGADLVALGKEAGFEFTQEEQETGWEELQQSDEELTAFELDVVSGGYGHRRGC